MKTPLIKAIIVEDDPLHYTRLKQVIQKNQPSVEVVAVATNVADAVDKIQKHKPDLVFLDIVLDHGEIGFNLLDKFEHPDFFMVVTTQYNTENHYLRALRLSAVDFITKPVSPEKLQAALEYYHKKNAEEVYTLRDNLRATEEKNTIVINTAKGKTKLRIEEILYCESSDNCTTFHVTKTASTPHPIITSRHLKHWENMLADTSVVRSHNQFLVNLKCAKKIIPEPEKGTATIYLNNNMVVPVSRSRKPEIMRRWGKL